MGRHYKAPLFHYRSKKARITAEEEIKKRRIKALTSQEKDICGFLHGYAIDVLQAAGRGYSVNELSYLRQLQEIEALYA